MTVFINNNNIGNWKIYFLLIKIEKKILHIITVKLNDCIHKH